MPNLEIQPGAAPGTLTAFAESGDNLETTLGGAYVKGSGTVQLAAGFGAKLAGQRAAYGYPAISAAAPVRFTMAAQSAYDSSGNLVDPTKQCIYLAPTLAGDVLTGLQAETGQTDQDFPSGSRWMINSVSRAFRDVHIAVNNNEAAVGQIVGGTLPIPVLDKGGQAYNVKAYGAKGDGSTDDTAAVQSLLTQLQATGGRLLFPAGRYMVPTALTFQSGKDIFFDGEPGAIIDGTASTATNLLTVGGTLQASAALAADVAAGAITITTTLTPAVGDILLLSTGAYCLANDPGTVAGRQALGSWWNPSRPGYYKGELVEVAAVAPGAPNTLTLRTALWDSYTAAQTTVRLMLAPAVKFRNLQILRNADIKLGLVINYTRNVEIDSLTMSGARERLLQIGYTYGGVVRNFRGTDFYNTTTGTSYGIHVWSAQNLRISDSNIRGGRHAIAHGGNEPCRNVIVSHNTLDNEHASGQCCLDYHGNTESCSAIGNFLGNGADSQCRNFKFLDNTIRAINVSGFAYTCETPCDYLTIRGNSVEVPNGDQIGILVRYGLAVPYGDVAILDNTVLNAQIGIIVSTSADLAMAGTISRLAVRDNTVVTVADPARAGFALQIVPASSGPAAGSTFTIGRASFHGGRYSSACISGAVQIANLTTPGTFTFHDVHAAALNTGPAMNLSSLGNVVMRSCRCETPAASGSTALVLQATGYAQLTDNAFVNSAVQAGLQVTAATISLIGNRHPGTTGRASLTGTVLRWFDNPGGTDILEPVQWLSSSPNLLSEDQSSFEVSGTEWIANVSCTVAPSTARAWTGRTSVAVTATATGNMSVVSGPSLTKGTNPAAVPGTTYTFSIHSLAATVGRTVQVTLQFYDGSGAQLGSTATATQTDNTATWIQSSVTATAPAGTVWARCIVLFLGTSGGGETHYFDGCMLASGSNVTYQLPGTTTLTAAGTGAVATGPGGFALGYQSTNQLTAGQSTFETADGLALWTLPVNCTLSLTTAAAWRGTQSMALTAAAAGDMSCETLAPDGTPYWPVAGSSQYTLLGYLRAATAPRTWNVQFFWYTSNKSLITSSTTTSADLTTAWRFAGLTATSPSTAAYVRLRFTCTAAGGAGEIHYLDGVSFAAGSSQTFVAGGASTLAFDGSAWIFTSPGGYSLQNAAGTHQLDISAAGVLTADLTGSLPDQAGHGGHFLQASGAGALAWASAAGAPGGSFNQVQYNAAGAFGGVANLAIAEGNLALAPNTPAAGSTDGELWYELNTLALTANVAGARGIVPLVLARGYSGSAITTTGEQSLLSGATVLGSLVLKANTLKAGTQLEICARGIESTLPTTPGNNRLNLKFNAVNVASGGSSTLPTNQVNTGWMLDATLVVESVGATGTIRGSGQETRTTSATGANTISLYALGQSPITINTTIDNTIDLTANFNTAGNSITLTFLSIKRS